MFSFSMPRKGVMVNLTANKHNDGFRGLYANSPLVCRIFHSPLATPRSLIESFSLFVLSLASPGSHDAG